MGRVELSGEATENEKKVSFLFDVIKRYDHYIGTTNFKVALMLSFLATVVIGLSFRFTTIEPCVSTTSYILIALYTSAILTIILSMITAYFLIRVVFPNTKNIIAGSSLVFFGDVSKVEGGAEGYLKKIKKKTYDDLLTDLATQTHQVATVTAMKFETLKLASQILSYGVLPFLTLSMILIILIG